MEDLFASGECSRFARVSTTLEMTIFLNIFYIFVCLLKFLCNFAMFLIKFCDEKLVIILIRVKKKF